MPKKSRPVIVVLTGAGVSAESGIKTFRDSDGLWEEYNVADVATPEAWAKDPKLVMRFYNARREQLLTAEPNAAHKALAEAEEWADVRIITQNIDDLHERAGSTNVLHLHGQLRKAQSERDPNLIIDIEGDTLEYGTRGPDGALLRPHVVWFGEAVPNIIPAAATVEQGDHVAVVGSSLNVYPAAGLLHYAAESASLWLVDPKPVVTHLSRHVETFQESAGTGVPKMLAKIKESYGK